MARIKVLMYGWEFPPQISGGLGIACHGIVKGLLENRIALSLVLPAFQQSPQIAAMDSLFEAISIKINFPASPVITPYYNESAAVYNSFNLVKDVLHYAKIAGSKASNIPHDVIHAHDWLSALAGIKAKKISKKPLIMHIHSLETDRGGTYPNTSIYNIEKYALAQADNIIAVSHYTKRSICQYYGIHPDKVRVVYNGIFPRRLYSPISSKKNNWVLFLGRITHQKGPFYFLQAAEKLLSLCKDVEFVVSGFGDQWQDMIQHVANQKLGRRIHFTGFLKQNEVEKIYSKCKIYVMPSISEPFGLACLEALSHGVPVIVSKNSGVKEVLPHLLSVDFWDTDDLASKMYALLNYKLLAELQIQQAWKILPTLTWTNVGYTLKEIYREICR